MTPCLVQFIGEAMVEVSPDECPERWRLGIAGDTLNTAWYLRRLLPRDWRVGFVSRVGRGPFSQRMLDFLTSSGIECAHVGQDPHREIGLYAITLRDGERSFTYWRDNSAARALADDADTLRRALHDCGLAFLSGITVAILPCAQRTTLFEVLRAARAGGLRVVFDPNLRPRLWPDARSMCAGIEAFAGLADLVLPSFDDEATHFGDRDPLATVQRYRALGVPVVVVKNGGGPIWFGDADGTGVVSNLAAVSPVDTTAAGDSFNAGFMAAWLRGESFETAIHAGHALGREVIRHRGALVPEAVDAERQ